MTRSKRAPLHELDATVAAKLAMLESLLADMGSVLIAVSGGTDSALLLCLAAGVPGLRHVALTSLSPTTPPHDLEQARTLATGLGSRHIIVEADELATPGYAENNANRCYLCKHTLYPLCWRVAIEEKCCWVADGVNTDDLNDYRPGLRAAEEQGVRHPFVEAAVSKEDIRALSRWLRLPTADKPASPCLASRFPYGTRITHEALARVANAETRLRSLGFREFRVRFFGETGQVEVSEAEQGRMAIAEVRKAVHDAVAAAGFHHVRIAPTPLRSGSLNDALSPVTRREAVARCANPSDA